MCDLVARADFLQDAGHTCVGCFCLVACSGWAFCFFVQVCLLFSKQLVQSATPPHSVPPAPNLHETNCVLLRDVGSVVLEIMLWGSRA